MGTDLIDSGGMATGAWEFDANNTAYTLVTSVAEMEGLEPKMSEKVWKQPDWVKWEEAVNAELKSLNEVHTWNIIERPVKTNIISCKWVFKIKKNAAGEINKYKAQLVVHSFMQKLGINYDDTYAPVT